MKNVLLLLELLTRKFPPKYNQTHSLSLYRGRLQLNLVIAAPCPKFLFDASDFERSPDQLVKEIAERLAADVGAPIA